MLDNRDRKGALRSVSVGRPEHVLAAVDHGGTLTLLGNHSVATRIFTAPVATDGDTAAGAVPGYEPASRARDHALLSVTRDVHTELARGSMSEMEAMRQRLSRDIMVSLRRGRGHRRLLLMTVCGLVGMVLGAACVLGLQPVPVSTVAGMPPVSGMPPMTGMPPMPMVPPPPPPAAGAGAGAPATHAPAATIPAPATGLPQGMPPQIGMPTLGDASRPASPVALDDTPVPAAPATAQLQGMPGPDAAPASQPAIQSAPVPDAAVPAMQALPPSPAAPVMALPAPVRPTQTNLPGVPTAPLPPPPSAVEPIPSHSAAVPQAAAPGPRASNLPASGPTGHIGSQAEAEEARQQLAALRQAQDDLKNHHAVSPETLAALPPGISQQFARASSQPPAAVSLAPRSTGPAGHDQYGIPTLPDSSSWAAIGPIDVPVPRGGDIKSPADMAKFGVR